MGGLFGRFVPRAYTMNEKSFYGWKLLCVFWLIIVLNFAFPTFATSVVNTYMAKAMHLNRKELGLAFSVFSLMAGLPAPLVAKSINKFGLRFTLFVGTLLTSCGAFLMASFVKTTSEAIVVFGIVVGAGVALAGTLGPQVGAARWFHRKRARAMSLLLTASGIGGFIAVPTLNAIIARFGTWRAAWWCMAFMSLAAAVVAALFVKDSPAQMGQFPDGDAAPRAPESAAALAFPTERRSLQDRRGLDSARSSRFANLVAAGAHLSRIFHGILHLHRARRLASRGPWIRARRKRRNRSRSF